MLTFNGERNITVGIEPEPQETATIYCPWCRSEAVHLVDEDGNYECKDCGELNRPRSGDI